jgi:hypothetical protein
MGRAIVSGGLGSPVARCQAKARCRPVGGRTRREDPLRPTRSFRPRRYSPRPRRPKPSSTRSQSPRPPRPEYTIRRPRGPRAHGSHSEGLCEGPTPWETIWYCREQPSLGENRTERMETRTTISTHRGEITDREAWLTLRAEIVTTQCSNPEPEPCPDVSKLWGSNLEPGPRRHRSYSACGLVILQFFDGPRGEGGGAKSAGAQPPQSCLPT